MKSIILTLLIPLTTLAQSNVIEVAGVLRNSGSGWFALNDESHTPANIARVTSDDRDLVVWWSFKPSKVITFVVTPDETLARAGINAGASVGLESAAIDLYANKIICKVVTDDDLKLSAKTGFTIYHDGPFLGESVCFASYRDGTPARVLELGDNYVLLRCRLEKGITIQRTWSGKVKPSELTTKVLPNSNFWFYGLFQL